MIFYKSAGLAGQSVRQMFAIGAIFQAPLGGAVAAPGTAVDLTVSLGPAPVAVPDVVGLPQATAEGTITAIHGGGGDLFDPGSEAETVFLDWFLTQ